MVIVLALWGFAPAQRPGRSSKLGELGNPPKASAPARRGGESTWCLILVNKRNPIPKQYALELTTLSNKEKVDKRMYPALQALFNAARADGVYPIVASGYRSAKKQQRLLTEKIAAYKASGYSASKAQAKAESWVAPPGRSEHQIGLDVDINADGVRSAGPEVYTWLADHAHQFGFILRYPPDKTAITGVVGETWHYRYVGVEAATEIHQRGICLEEYLGE
jgi:D-alanyl-D-alanine carboxypeptidase